MLSVEVVNKEKRLVEFRRNKKRGLKLKIRTTDSHGSVCKCCCLYNNLNCNETEGESPCEMLRLEIREYFVIDNEIK